MDDAAQPGPPRDKAETASNLYEQVFENNRRWARAHLENDPGFFTKLALGQDPEFLFIGCSDSRVPASEVMGLRPGRAFVHRNVANLVVNTDLNAQAVVQFGVEHLDVRHIIVCGHYGCGGVAAAMQSRDLGLLNGWLREIRDIYRLHAAELDAIADRAERYRRLVELNVHEQCINVIKTSWVQQSYLSKGFPTVHGWVYDLDTGLLKDLKIGFEERLRGIREIYHLE